MSKRVVISGIGPVTSAGIGKEAFFDGIWRNPPSPQPIPARFQEKYSFVSKWYQPLPEFSLSAHQLRFQGESLMNSSDRMAVLAAKLALDDARLEKGFTEDTGILLGTGLSDLNAALESYLTHCVPREILQSISKEPRPPFARMVIPKTMPNSPAGWISICFGLKGPSNTVNASCASGTIAVGEAFRRVKDGYARVILTGAVESLQNSWGAVMRGFDVLGVLTRSEDGQPNPFGTDRSGFLFAEGGACGLVLEELEHALERGAPIYAEIKDYQSNSDAVNLLQIDPSGAQITRLLSELSKGRRIDYVNAHGTGTIPNDSIEAQVIQTVFGSREKQPWINSTKGILGHTLGASGAIETAVTALTISRGIVHPNRVRNPMKDLNLPLEPIAAQIEGALSVSYGFGGHNAGLFLSNYER